MSLVGRHGASRFRDALELQGRARCLSVRLIAEPVVAHMAAAAGFEAIYVDLEHSVISPAEAASICLAADMHGMAAWLRLPPEFSPSGLGALLDAGVMGFILTGLEDAEAVKSFISATRFPPYGQRSINWATPSSGYRFPADVEVHLAQKPYVAVMIETEAAVEMAREIAALDGVDMLFMGCGDLSLTLGLKGQTDNPQIADMCTKVALACREYGRDFGLGGAGKAPQLVADMLAVGPTMLTGGSDQSLLADAFHRQAAHLAA